MTYARLLPMTLLLLIACACSSPESTSTDASDATGASTSADPLTGTWTGNWGPTTDKRNAVTIALDWDGTNVTGTVNPGVNAIAITKGGFAADTGVLTIEASGNGTDGKMVHYTAEGKLVDGAISGTWNDGDTTGDFKVTKQPLTTQ